MAEDVFPPSQPHPVLIIVEALDAAQHGEEVDVDTLRIRLRVRLDQLEALVKEHPAPDLAGLVERTRAFVQRAESILTDLEEGNVHSAALGFVAAIGVFAGTGEEVKRARAAAAEASEEGEPE